MSVIDLLLVRNLYELGYPEPDPTVSVSFTPEQRLPIWQLVDQPGTDSDLLPAAIRGATAR